MKILSWNICQGGGNRISGQIAAIASHNADTVALCEVSVGRQKELKEGLESIGFKHFHLPPIEKNQRGVLIASRSRFEPVAPRKSEGLSTHRWGEVRFPREAITLAGVYFPDTAKPIVEFWPRVHAACASLKDECAMIVGDFNSGHNAFDTQSSTFSGDPWFSAMALQGFTDLWRHKHGSRLDYTWFSKRGEIRNGFRIDHAFGSQAMRRRVTACEYSHAERDEGLSDHSILVCQVR